MADQILDEVVRRLRQRLPNEEDVLGIAWEGLEWARREYDEEKAPPGGGSSVLTMRAVYRALDAHRRALGRNEKPVEVSGNGAPAAEAKPPDMGWEEFLLQTGLEDNGRPHARRAYRVWILGESAADVARAQEVSDAAVSRSLAWARARTLESHNGAPHPRGLREWSEEDDAAVLALRRGEAEGLAKRIGRSASAIRTRRWKLKNASGTSRGATGTRSPEGRKEEPST